MSFRKGSFWLTIIVGAALLMISSGLSYAGDIGGGGIVQDPLEPLVGCNDPNDVGTIGQVYVDLGQPVGVPITIASPQCINHFRFEFYIPAGLEIDSVTNATWTGGFDNPAYDWNSTTRHLVVGRIGGSAPCITPSINDVFIRLWFSTCTTTQQNVYKYITWVPNPADPAPPLNWLGYADCSTDPISTLNNGWVKINPISISFDISEETALIGDTVIVTVNCNNSYLFDQFTNYWIHYDDTKLYPIWDGFLIPTPRTDGGLDDPQLFGTNIGIRGTKPGGYGTSWDNGPAFYRLRFKVISPIENSTTLLTWSYSGLHTYAIACHKDLNTVTPNPISYLSGSVTVPVYQSLIDFGDAVGSNHSSCDSIKVPILLTNNFRVGGFQLVIDYGDNNDPNWDAIGVLSTDAFNYPLDLRAQVCGTSRYAIVYTVGAPVYPVSTTPQTIGWLVLRASNSTQTPTYTVQLIDTDCQPYNDRSWLSTYDPIRTWTTYYLPDAQFDAAPGTVTIGAPLAQMSVPSANARYVKPGYYYEGFAFSGIYVQSNADLDSAWFTLTWDASRFCIGFSALSPNALVVGGNGTAYIRVSGVKASSLYQRYGTIRVDNKRSTDQTGSLTVSAASAKMFCDHTTTSATGVGGGIHLGPGGGIYSCDIEQQQQNLLKPANVPEHFELIQNYPNPFNASTVINFDLAEPGQTTLEIYNIMGQRVATLFDSYTAAGKYSIHWDGRDPHGQSVATGVYLYRLQSGTMTATKKMVLLK